MRYFIVLSLFCTLLSSCGSSEKKKGHAHHHGHNHDHDHDHDHGHYDHGYEQGYEQKKAKSHVHHAPNGGTLIDIANEFAHIEILAQAEKGQITCYLFDADIKFGEKAEQSMIKCFLTCKELEEPLSIEFLPVINELAGNSATSSSEFVTKVDLKDKTNIKLQLKSLKIKGNEFKDIFIEVK